MNITNAYYLVPRDDDGKIVSGAAAIGIKAIVDGTPCQIPIDSANTMYAEIQKQEVELKFILNGKIVTYLIFNEILF